jgi:hypothetical protein
VSEISSRIAGLARFEGRGSLRSWLYTVATRTCLDTVQRPRRDRRHPTGRRRLVDAAAGRLVPRRRGRLRLRRTGTAQRLRKLEAPPDQRERPAGRGRNDDAGAHLGWSITVLTLRGEHIAEITSFIGPGHFAPFGLPASLP